MLSVVHGQVSDDWTYKIGDLGMSRVKEVQADTGDTALMTQCGTPKWTPPEIFKGQKCVSLIVGRKLAMLCVFRAFAQLKL